MSDAPAVSVLLTTYNHAQYVEQALESVAAQAFTDFELIVTDDCSTDGSADVIRRWLERTGFPATFIVNERNVGICAVRNHDLRLARGRFACSLSGDDWYEPDRLERQAGFFAAQPEDVAVVYSDVHVDDVIGSGRAPSYLATSLHGDPPPEGRVFDEILRRNFLPAAGVMLRRSAVEEVGGYDESMSFEDFDMWLRLADRFTFRHLPGYAGGYRVLATSMSSDLRWRRDMGNDRNRILLKWLGRSAGADAVIAGRVRGNAMRTASWDCAATLAALQAVQHVDGSPKWRAVIAMLSVPGAGAALAGVRRIRERARPHLG